MKISTRRGFLPGLLTLMALFGLKRQVHAQQNDRPADAPPFAHIVFFWLKNPEDGADREALRKHVHNYLSKIDLIRQVHFGQPAGTPREVVDNSYTYNMILYFDNQEDQDRYQAHPAHLKFVEDASHLWDRVQVYDSIAG